MKIKEILALQYIRTKIKFLGAVAPDKAAAEVFRLFCTPIPTVTDGLPAAFSYAEPLYIKINDVRIKGYRWNKGKNKKVLIVHGFSSASYKFQGYIIPLMEKDYEVVAFDAKAHGESSGETLNAVEYAKMLEKVIKVFGPFDGFIAHSFGCLALTLALEKTAHDENLKMVLIAPATETTSAISAAFKKLAIKNEKVKTAFEKLIIKEGGHSSKWFSIKRAIPNVKAKVLWIHDEKDTVTPLKDALKVKELHLPNIEFLITEGLGHRRIYHDHGVKKEIFDFL